MKIIFKEKALVLALAVIALVYPIRGICPCYPRPMGLTAYQGGMILLTMLTAMINFNDGETNSLEGLVHLVLFLTFSMLIFLQP